MFTYVVSGFRVSGIERSGPSLAAFGGFGLLLVSIPVWGLNFEGLLPGPQKYVGPLFCLLWGGLGYGLF